MLEGSVEREPQPAPGAPLRRAVGVNKKAEAGPLRPSAVSRVDDQPKLPEAVENLAEIVEVELKVGAGNRDVVEINEVQPGPNAVHEALEGVSRIPLIPHNNKLPQAELIGDSGLKNFGGDAYSLGSNPSPDQSGKTQSYH